MATPVWKANRQPEELQRNHAKAALARRAIEDQDGPREHVHRPFRSEQDPIATSHQQEEARYLKVKEELQAAHLKMIAINAEISSATTRRFQTGQHIPHEQWSRLQADLVAAKMNVHRLQTTAGSLRATLRSRARPFESTFMDCAKVMLPPDVFEEIKATAAKCRKGIGLGGIRMVE